MNSDLSNGYDEVAEDFIALRSQTTGVSSVRSWSASFHPGDRILDIGCGSGLPLTALLIERGLNVSAIDASPKMVAEFERNFPDIEIACEAVESSVFFNRQYDGILAVELIFLLPPDAQRRILPRIAKALNSGGRLLFSAPKETGNWTDVLTKREPYSLGETEYHQLLTASGLNISRSHSDEGGSHYYAAKKPG